VAEASWKMEKSKEFPAFETIVKRTGKNGVAPQHGRRENYYVRLKMLILDLNRFGSLIPSKHSHEFCGTRWLQSIESIVRSCRIRIVFVPAMPELSEAENNSSQDDWPEGKAVRIRAAD
jgi:hypothetical protein